MIINKTKLIEDLNATLKQMELFTKLFDEGNTSVYRSIAVQLRLLLTKKDPLIKKIFKKSAFHPLRGVKFPPEIQKHLVLQTHALISFNKGKPTIEKLFNENAVPLLVDEWLDQSILTKNITIRTLIDSIADKEGAHADNNYNSTLNTSRSIYIGTEMSHQQYIIAIAKYVTKSLINIQKELNNDLINWKSG